MTKIRHLFISHSWAHSEHYLKIQDFLDEAGRFEFIDHSVPKDDPIHTAPKSTPASPSLWARHFLRTRRHSTLQNTAAKISSKDHALWWAIKGKIDQSEIVLIVAGVYATYSKWISIEIDIAKECHKPILAIRPWGADRVSDKATENANEIVYWNTDSIVSAIRRLVP